MITAIRHVGLVVADLEGALCFWRDVLGFRVTRRLEESGSYIDAILGLAGARLTTIKLAAPDGNLVELLHFHSHPDKPKWTGTPFSTGLTHLALSVSDVDAFSRKLSEAGVTFDAPPQLTPDGYAKVTFGRGPEGILLELVQVMGQ